MICYECMNDSFFLFWFTREMMQYEMNPSMMFYDGWRMEGGHVGNDGNMCNSDPQEMKRTMKVKTHWG